MVVVIEATASARGSGSAPSRPVLGGGYASTPTLRPCVEPPSPRGPHRRARLRQLDRVLTVIEEWNLSGSGNLDALCDWVSRVCGVDVQGVTTGTELHEAVLALQEPLMDTVEEGAEVTARVCPECLMVLPPSAFSAGDIQKCLECCRRIRAERAARKSA